MAGRHNCSDGIILPHYLEEKDGFGLDPQWCSKMFVKDICAMDAFVAGSSSLGLAVSLFMFL